MMIGVHGCMVEKRKPPGNYGMPHLHVAVADEKVTNPLTGEGQTMAPGGMSDGQYQQMKRQVESQGLGGMFSGNLSGFGSSKYADLISKMGGMAPGAGDAYGKGAPAYKDTGGAYQLPSGSTPSFNTGIGNMFKASSGMNKGAMNVRGQQKVVKSIQSPFGALLGGGQQGGGPASEHGINDNAASRGGLFDNPLMKHVGG